MPIVYKDGDMFETHAEAIVNTVNCVGVMGKGVALQFKNRWPENFKAYKAACLKKQVKTGKMFVHKNGNMFENPDYNFLINFPTKQHWRSKSKIEFIIDGLNDLVSVLKFHNIQSVCIPPLGCGNGGLNWKEVRPLIERSLSEISLTRNIFIFGPLLDSDIPEYQPLALSMTEPRAALFRALGDFESYFGGSYTKISLQKIVYFLQVLGIDFGMQFKKNIYGPYSSTLAKALIDIGQGNGLITVKNSIENEQTVRCSAVAYTEAADYIETNNLAHIDIALEKLSQLISGFESAFGMELLSSVHYIARSKNTSNLDEINSSIKIWSDRKRNLFDKETISNALNRLLDDDLLVV